MKDVELSQSSFLNNIPTHFFYSVEVEADSRTQLPLANYSNSWPLYGQIEFKNYYAKYRPNLPYVLKDVSFKINSSEKVLFFEDKT